MDLSGNLLGQTEERKSTDTGINALLEATKASSRLALLDLKGNQFTGEQRDHMRKNVSVGDDRWVLALGPTQADEYGKHPLQQALTKFASKAGATLDLSSRPGPGTEEIKYLLAFIQNSSKDAHIIFAGKPSEEDRKLLVGAIDQCANQIALTFNGIEPSLHLSKAKKR